jgi:hypothetical protein
MRHVREQDRFDREVTPRTPAKLEQPLGVLAVGENLEGVGGDEVDDGEDEVEDGDEEGLHVKERLPIHVAKALELHHVDVEVEEQLPRAQCRVGMRWASGRRGYGEGTWR